MNPDIVSKSPEIIITVYVFGDGEKEETQCRFRQDFEERRSDIDVGRFDPVDVSLHGLNHYIVFPSFDFVHLPRLLVPDERVSEGRVYGPETSWT